MTRDELSLLLYLETCAVDFGGAVDARRMNKEDFDTAAQWAREGFIEFGRICAADIKTTGPQQRTQWVRLSDAAWTQAHAERRARFARVYAKRNWRTTKEHRAQPVETCPQEEDKSCRP